MRRFRCMGTLFLVFGMAAVLLHILSGIRGFPQQIMLVFWPADYVRQQLRQELAQGVIRTVVSNVAVFGLLAGIEGGLLGLILDLYLSHRQEEIKRRVHGLGYARGPTDRAFTRRITEILAKYDPAGLLDSGSAEQGYGPEAKMILASLGKLRNAKALARFCQQRFRQAFGRKMVRAFHKYDSLAGDIWREYQRLLSSPRPRPPTSEGL